MAKQVIKVGVVTLGGVDYSAQIANASIEITVEEGDTTNYAGDGWKERVAGLKSYQLNLEFKKDALLSGLDAAIRAVINGATGLTAWTSKMTSGAISTDNPEFSGSVLVTNWNTGPGPLGQVYGGSVTWPGSGAVAVDVTP